MASEAFQVQSIWACIALYFDLIYKNILYSKNFHKCYLASKTNVPKMAESLNRKCPQKYHLLQPDLSIIECYKI